MRNLINLSFICENPLRSRSTTNVRSNKDYFALQSRYVQLLLAALEPKTKIKKPFSLT